MSDVLTNSQDSLGESLFEGSLAPNDSVSTVVTAQTLGFDNTSSTNLRHRMDFALITADSNEAHERLKDYPVYPS